MTNHIFLSVHTSNDRTPGKKLPVSHVILTKQVAPKTVFECIKSKQKLWIILLTFLKITSDSEVMFYRLHNAIELLAK